MEYTAAVPAGVAMCVPGGRMILGYKRGSGRASCCACLQGGCWASEAVVGLAGVLASCTSASRAVRVLLPNNVTLPLRRGLVPVPLAPLGEGGDIQQQARSTSSLLLPQAPPHKYERRLPAAVRLGRKSGAAKPPEVAVRVCSLLRSPMLCPAQASLEKEHMSHEQWRAMALSSGWSPGEGGRGPRSGEGGSPIQLCLALNYIDCCQLGAWLLSMALARTPRQSVVKPLSLRRPHPCAPCPPGPPQTWPSGGPGRKHTQRCLSSERHCTGCGAAGGVCSKGSSSKLLYFSNLSVGMQLWVQH